MKRSELETLQKTVHIILENDIKARNNDDYLYTVVCRRLNSDCANHSFIIVMANRKLWNLPSYESVGRTRRKLQKEHPELASFERTKRNRKLQEHEYLEYARS